MECPFQAEVEDLREKAECLQSRIDNMIIDRDYWKVEIAKLIGGPDVISLKSFDDYLGDLISEFKKLSDEKEGEK